MKPRGATLDQAADALDRAAQAFRAAPLGFAGLSALATVAAEVAVSASAAESTWASGIGLAAVSVTWSVSTAPMTMMLGDLYRGSAPDLTGALRTTARRAISLAVAAVLWAAAVLGGTLLLIVPGLIFVVRSFAFQPILLLEEQTIRGSFLRSWELSRGYGWTILLVTLPLWLLEAATPELATYAADGAQVPALAIRLLLGLPITYLGTALPVALYFRARVEREGFDVEVAAERLALPGPDGSTPRFSALPAARGGRHLPGVPPAAPEAALETRIEDDVCGTAG